MPNERSKTGLIVAGAFGLTSVGLLALATPFVLPALRKHCLPYLPATDNQLANLMKAFKKHARKGDTFIDIGSGDGRICRLSARSGLFSQVHGVELNYILVILSRLLSIRAESHSRIKYYHKDLWRYPIGRYDSVCIFGVESMMEPFEDYLMRSNFKKQTIFACRFPLNTLKPIDEIGTGIDTVWIYKLSR